MQPNRNSEASAAHFPWGRDPHWGSSTAERKLLNKLPRLAGSDPSTAMINTVPFCCGRGWTRGICGRLRGFADVYGAHFPCP